MTAIALIEERTASRVAYLTLAHANESLPARAASVLTRRGLKRRRIIESARKTFLRHGYAGTSMSQLAAEIGGSKGTFYGHFDSKAAIFSAVIEDLTDQVRSRLDALTLSENDLGAALRAVGRRYVRELLSPDWVTMIRTLIAEADHFPEIGDAVTMSGMVRGPARLVALLDQAIARGELVACDPVIAAEQFFDLVFSGPLLRQLWAGPIHTSDTEIDTKVDAAVQLFLTAHGVMAASPTPIMEPL